MQDSLEDRRHGAAPGANSLISKARNVLNSAIAKGLGGDFCRMLLDDLQNHGTLSDRTLRKFIDAFGNDREFEDLIARLKNQMGEKYVDELKDKLPPNEVLIAIEHK